MCYGTSRGGSGTFRVDSISVDQCRRAGVCAKRCEIFRITQSGRSVRGWLECRDVGELGLSRKGFRMSAEVTEIVQELKPEDMTEIVDEERERLERRLECSPDRVLLEASIAQTEQKNPLPSSKPDDHNDPIDPVDRPPASPPVPPIVQHCVRWLAIGWVVHNTLFPALPNLSWSPTLSSSNNFDNGVSLTLRTPPTQAFINRGGVYFPRAPSTTLLSSLIYLGGLAKIFPAWTAVQRKTAIRERVDTREILGAAMLVAGGTVGAGIVALPVKTAAIGFVPSAAALIAGWGFMLVTSFIILDVNAYCGKGANFTTMAEMTLGRGWRGVCAALYVVIYGATLTAYISESATFIGPTLSGMIGKALPPAASSLMFATVFGGIIHQGTDMVDKTNTICVAIALLAFTSLLGYTGASLGIDALLHAKWFASIKTLPIVIVAFTFHNMIPSLFKYLGSVKAVRKALFIGTLIPLVMYLVWEAMILGSLPVGSSVGSIDQIVRLVGFSGGGEVTLAIKVFSLFAIITSFLGVGLGCLDFIKDLLEPYRGYNEPERPRNKGKRADLAPLIYTMGPPVMITCLCPSLFMTALEISGVLRIILFAVIPALMAHAGPYKHGQSFWKNALLALVVCTAFGIIGIDVWGKLPRSCFLSNFI